MVSAYPALTIDLFHGVLSTKVPVDGQQRAGAEARMSEHDLPISGQPSPGVPALGVVGGA
jgi:hypothetical protein